MFSGLVVQGLDLVAEGDQLTHEIDLEADVKNLKTMVELDVFRPDPDFEQHEAEYEVRFPCLEGRNFLLISCG